MMRTVVIAGLAFFVLGSSLTPAQQLVNGQFTQAGLAWTNVIPAGPNTTFADLDGDGDTECVFIATNLLAHNDNVILVQDFPSEFIDLRYGIALNADIGGTNLNENIRAFTKLEFLLTNNNVIGVDGAFDPSNFVTGTAFRSQATLVKQHKSLASDLSGAGLGLDAVAFVRATMFLYRFDTNATIPTGRGYFDNLSFGLVSKSYDVPGVVNGGFEYNDWAWRESAISSEGGFAVDRDNDGDKELVFPAAGLTNAFNGLLWVQEFDAKVIDFTQGISLTADIGATNLSPNFRLFSKLEFYTNAGPYLPGTVVMTNATLDGASSPTLYVTNSETKYGVTLSKSYSSLTNELAQEGAFGATADDLTMVRVVFFFLPFVSDPAPTGESWVDNVRLNFAFRDRPNVSSVRANIAESVVTWSSQTGRTYRVQGLSDLRDFHWSNIAVNVAGQAGSTSFTNANVGSNRYLRVVRD